MLRITAHDDLRCLMIQLEGRQAGPWVRELEDCWQSTRTRASQRKPVLRFDLTDVTDIDAADQKFLAARYTEGAKFLALSSLMRAVVAEITDAPVPDRGRPESGGERGRN
jgi:hypothetical protein